MRELQHYFRQDVKHCISYPLAIENQGVLDAKKLAKKLRDAMDQREPRVTGAELAAACGVTVQAVSNWRSTGRFAKRHLPNIANVTGQSIEYFVTESTNVGLASGKTGQTEKLKDSSNFKIVLRAWQEATPDNRDTMLKLATTILKLDGTRQRKRTAS